MQLLLRLLLLSFLSNLTISKDKRFPDALRCRGICFLCVLKLLLLAELYQLFDLVVEIFLSKELLQA